ncbi:MAG: ammonium transporter [Deltaproteobacteria bacterium]|nr:ammonium transporter [Deltaproteobacteria bacterium]
MQTTMRKNKKEWVVSLGLLFGAGFLGLLVPVAAPLVKGGPIVPGDVAWMLTATALVLLMTPGLSFFYGGMVQRKNVISTLLQSFIAMGVVSLLWILVGFSLSFGKSIGGFVGNPLDFFMFRHVGSFTHPDLAPTIPLALFAMFQLKFAIITPALITGSFAERVRFASYIIFISLFSLLIYAPIAHWTWHPQGFLRQWGVLDFAGGTVVHMSAGFAALAGALALGRRKIHLASATTRPANIPFVLLGLGMLWFGWFGFNSGSALAANELAVLAFINTNTASAAAMLAWMFYDAVRGRRPSALGAAIGAVVGLVAITPACGFVTVGQSIVIGIAASIISNLVAHWRSKSQLDDTLDVFPCHGVGGIVGMIATGLFAEKVGLIHGDPTLFIRHLLAIVIVGAYSFGGSYILYKLTDFLVSLRVRPEQEEAGLDISQHAESY